MQQVTTPVGVRLAEGEVPATIRISLEAGHIARLPDDANLSQPRLNGADLEFVQPDGTVIVIVGGAVANLVLYLGDVQLTGDAVAALLSAHGIETAAGSENETGGAHGSFNDPGPRTVGTGFDTTTELLADSSTAATPGGTIQAPPVAPPIASITAPNTVPTQVGTLEISVYESHLPAGSAAADTSLAGSLAPIVAGGVSRYAVELTDLSADLQNLTSGGQPVTYTLQGNSLVAWADGAPVFIFAVTAATGDYTFTLKAPLDHLAPDGREITLDLSSAVTVYDADGDGDELALSGGLIIRIVDDAPVAVAETAVVFDEDGGARNGNVLFNDKGADDATLTHVTFDGGRTWLAVGATGTTTHAVAGVGTYAFTATGTWSFTPDADFNGSADFAYVATDRDGDDTGFAVTGANTQVITVTPVNDAPDTVDLSNTSIAENGKANAVVGTLSAHDVDSTELTYALVSGVGDADNAKFSILGNELRLLDPADYETQSSYSIRLQVSDGGGGTYEVTKTITVTDVNEAPSLALANVKATIAENTATTGGIKVADIVVSDDALGSNILSLVGADKASFEIRGDALYFIGKAPDYESKSSYAVSVTVDDPVLGSTVEAVQDFVLAVTDVNEAPTLALANLNSTIAENTNTSGGIKVADIVVSDDALGSNILSLVGADNASFEIRGDALYFIGKAPDYESKSSYAVSVTVDDPVLGSTVEAVQDLVLTVTDVNEAPSLALANVKATITENTNTSGGIKVADIVVSDDALGSNILSLVGADKSSFEIRGNALYFIGDAPDYETKSSYAVSVTVDDLTLGSTVEASQDFVLTVTDVFENRAPVANPDTVAIIRPEGDGWILNTANGHYYKFIGDPTDAATARAAAEATGGYLANITSMGEQSFLWNQISGAGKYWLIGASDIRSEGTFRWENGLEAGTLLNYSNWYPLGPDNWGLGEDHVAIGPQGYWHDVGDAARQGYIIEWHAPYARENVVTSFRTATLLANDSDPDGHALSVTGLGAGNLLTGTSARGATITLDLATGQISYNPINAADVRTVANGATLVDTFQYWISDGHGGTASATASITVGGVRDNAPPLITVVSTGSSTSQNVLFNGGFEIGGTGWTYEGVSTYITGQSRTGTGNLQTDTGTLSQTIDTVAGQTYTLSFWLRGSKVDGGSNWLKASFGETEVLSIANVNQGYTKYTFQVTATGASTTLHFSFSNPSGYWYFDDIQLTDPSISYHRVGDIGFTDADIFDVHTATATATGNNYVGRFVVDPTVTGGGGNSHVGWNFYATDADLARLPFGTTQQTYTVTVSDDHGGTVTRDITVDVVRPTNAAPVVTEVTTTSVVVDTASLVTNGGFESGLGGWSRGGATDWTGVGTYQGRTAYEAGSTSSGTLSQSFATVAGQTYVFSFWLAGTGGNNATFAASWNGQTLMGLSYADQGFTQYTYQVTATGPTTTVTFTSMNSRQYWYIDDISVTRLHSYNQSGIISFTDHDVADIHVAAVSAPGSGYKGTFSVDPTATEGGGSGYFNWRFAATAAEIAQLPYGTTTQTYAVTISDGRGGNVVRNISVDIERAQPDIMWDGWVPGDNDAPSNPGSYVATLSTNDPAGASGLTYQIVNDTNFTMQGNRVVAVAPGVGVGTHAVTVLVTNSRGESYQETFNVVFESNDSNATTITGSTRDDIIYARQGADTVNAGAGNDVIYGQGGNDTLNGQDGNDVLDGGAGADRLTGGAGSDTFRFASGQSSVAKITSNTVSGYDIITDFNTSQQDKIDFTTTPVVAADVSRSNGNGKDVTIAGVTVTHHSISNGIITFYNGSTAHSLDTAAKFAAAIAYLQSQTGSGAVDLGNAGSLVAFTSTFDGAAHTFLYQQIGNTPDVSKDLLIDLGAASIGNLASLVGSGNRIDPIVLDLDGNGIHFDTVASFDLDHDGTPDQLGWPGAGDGLLAIDLDRSGAIESGNEVFSPSFGAGGHADSLAALATLDSNGDGKLTSADAQFADLLVWRDLDGDGISEAGELASLGDLDIIEIDLDALRLDRLQDGQHIFAEGTFTKADGSVHSYVGVDLVINEFVTDYPDGDAIDLSTLLGAATDDTQSGDTSAPDYGAPDVAQSDEGHTNLDAGFSLIFENGPEPVIGDL